MPMAEPNYVDDEFLNMQRVPRAFRSSSFAILIQLEHPERVDLSGQMLQDPLIVAPRISSGIHGIDEFANLRSDPQIERGHSARHLRPSSVAGAPSRRPCPR